MTNSFSNNPQPTTNHKYMKPPLEFFVQGIPKGQPRAKACRRGKFTSVYDPGTADEWKLMVRNDANLAWDKVPFEGPLSLTLRFTFPRPKSHYNSKGIVKDSAPNWHTSKPDFDNAAKAVADALTNIGIWKDDSQVCSSLIFKDYGPTSGCRITIKEMEK